MGPIFASAYGVQKKIKFFVLIKMAFLYPFFQHLNHVYLPVAHGTNAVTVTRKNIIPQGKWIVCRLLQKTVA